MAYSDALISRLQKLTLVPEVLADIQGHRNVQTIYRDMFPIVPVESEWAIIPLQSDDNVVLYTNQKRGIRGPSNVISPTDPSTTTVQLEERDLGFPVDYRERGNYDIERYAAMTAQDGIEIGTEYDVATLVQNPANYHSSCKGYPDIPWNHHSDESLSIYNDLIGLFELYRSVNGKYPSDIAFATDVWMRGVLNAPEFNQLLPNSDFKIMTEDIILKMFSKFLKRVHIGTQNYKNAVTDTLYTDIWSNTVVLWSKKEDASLYAPDFGITIQGQGFPLVDTYADPRSGGKVDIIRSTVLNKPVMTSNKAAVLFYNVIDA